MDVRKRLQVALGARFEILDQDSGFTGTYLARVQGTPEGSAPTHVVECWPEARDDSLNTSLDEEAGLLMRWPAPPYVQLVERGYFEESEVPAHRRPWRSVHCYTVITYVEGVMLSSLLRTRHARREGMPLLCAVAIGMAVADALSRIHALNAPNGEPLETTYGADLSNHTVLGTDGRIWILPPVSLWSAGGGSVGRSLIRLERAAPEQVRSEPATQALDCYALGVLLWECLTGSRPIVRTQPLETLRAIQQDSPPALTGVIPWLPTELEGLVRALLAKAPAERPNAAMAVRALASIQAALGPAATVEVQRTRLLRSEAQNPGHLQRPACFRRTHEEYQRDSSEAPWP